MRVRKPRHGLRFGAEPMLRRPLTEGLPGELDGDISSKTSVHRMPDLAHSSLSDKANKAVASIQSPSSLTIERTFHTAILPFT